MTNEMIIAQAVVESGLMTKETVDAYFSAGYRLPVHTYSEWKRLGYQVKKGEKAKLKILLWKHSSKKNADDKDETHMFMSNAYMFTFEQVEKMPKFETKTKEDIRAYNKMLAEQRRNKATA